MELIFIKNFNKTEHLAVGTYIIKTFLALFTNNKKLNGD